LRLAKRSSFMRPYPLECQREAHRCSELSETAATELGRQIYSREGVVLASGGFRGSARKTRCGIPEKEGCINAGPRWTPGSVGDAPTAVASVVRQPHLISSENPRGS
jgi:hypothetical protein